MTTIFAKMSDAEAQAVFDRLEKALADKGPAFREIGERMEQRVRDAFRLEADPWGVQWPPHAPSTIADRERRGIAHAQKLIDSGDLYRSIDAEWDANSATISVGEGPSEAYASVHQFGERAGRMPGFLMPRRSFLPLHSPDVAAIPDEWLDDVVAPLEDLLQKAILG